MYKENIHETKPKHELSLTIRIGALKDILGTLLTNEINCIVVTTAK